MAVTECLSTFVHQHQSSPPKPDNMSPNDKLQPISEAEAPLSSSQGGVSVDGSPSTSVSSRDQNRTTVSKYLKGKEREWNKVSDRKGPLTLLELPVDILRLIVKEVSSLLYPEPGPSSAPLLANLTDHRSLIQTTSPLWHSQIQPSITSPCRTYMQDLI